MSTKHLGEEQLIAAHYGEADPATTTHLAQCAACRSQAAGLAEQLAAFVPGDEPELSDAQVGAIWHHVRQKLDAPRMPFWRSLLLTRLRIAGLLATCALLLVATFFAGRVWEHKQALIARQQTPAAQPARVVVVLMGEHLDRSERLLVEFKHADASDQQLLTPIREEAGSLLIENQRYRNDAHKLNDPELDQALAHLDELLGRLSASHAKLSEQDLEMLQKQMNDEGLLLEVRLLRSRIENAYQSGNNRGGSL